MTRQRNAKGPERRSSGTLTLAQAEASHTTIVNGLRDIVTTADAHAPEQHGPRVCCRWCWEAFPCPDFLEATTAIVG